MTGIKTSGETLFGEGERSSSHLHCSECWVRTGKGDRETERERERQAETERERQRQTDRHRHRDRHRDRKIQRETERETETVMMCRKLVCKIK